MNLEQAILAVRQGHPPVKVRCPAHDDRTASLAVAPGTDQPVLLTCHADCGFNDILAAANLDITEVCAPLEVTPRNPAPIVYSYTDENGTELFQALRYTRPDGRKDFRQRHRENGDWVWNLRGVTRVLYRMPQVVEAVRNGTLIVVVEGEKDVHTAESLGLVATCNPMGAGKWLPEYTEVLRGATVHIIADRDIVGQRHAREVAEQLRAADCTVRTFETAMPDCKDLSDHITAGGTVDTLVETTHGSVESSPSTDDGEVMAYINMTFPAEEFVIPDTLAHEERLLVTGLEGHGKSTLLRQVAVQVACGIHPWTGREMPPQRVLVIDAENGKRQMQRSWRDLIGLAGRHGHPFETGMLHICFEYLRQPDLCSLEGREWFFERVAGFQPALIVIGPVQNLTGRDVKDDDVVRRFKRTVDEGRDICHSAVIMEHHCPHKAPGDKERNLRPYGSSLFMKWPDFGFGMRPTEDHDVYDFVRTRLPRERSRQWPDRLRIGTPNTMEWPWEVAPPAEHENVVRGRF